MSQATKQVRIVALDKPVSGQDFEPTAFFDAEGNPVDIGGGDGGVPEARLVPEGGASGQVLKVGADGPAWATDTNTTYPALTAAQAQAGTATAASTISAKVLADEIDRRVAAAIAAIPPAAG